MTTSAKVKNEKIYQRYSQLVANSSTVILFHNTYKDQKIVKLRAALKERYGNNFTLCFAKTKIFRKIMPIDFKQSFFILALNQETTFFEVAELLATTKYTGYYKANDICNKTVLIDAHDTSYRPNQYFNFLKTFSSATLKKGYVAFEKPFTITTKNEKITAQKANALVAFNFMIKDYTTDILYAKINDKIYHAAWCTQMFTKLPVSEDISELQLLYRENATYDTAVLNTVLQTYSLADTTAYFAERSKAGGPYQNLSRFEIALLKYHSLLNNTDFPECTGLLKTEIDSITKEITLRTQSTVSTNTNTAEASKAEDIALDDLF